MQFTKVRLSGFKSFVEPTDLHIAPGLTGVVGPNGCGKSNLFEALRWAMGETSAKQMRGGEMDNVIFGGTSNRPARNVAEVVIQLDNSGRTAPSQFNDYDDLEVSRRIEREKGSVYRVNGREVRARDVQILFADHATGPRSTALVSQGRIGAIIAAKPQARRMLLEEAAGITGLHSRRHEAELRLRAAETNLERLDDVLVTLDEQLASLKKQARQARRYRNISDHIRQTEAAVLHQRWAEAQNEVSAAKTAFAQAEQLVAVLTRQTAAATTRREEAAAALAPLREAEATAAAELQRLTLARSELDAEERRVDERRRQGEGQLSQIDQDLSREAVLAEDAGTALEKLAAEAEEITAAQAGETAAAEAAGAALEQATTTSSACEQEHTSLTEAIASGEARRTALEREIASLERRAEELRQRFTQVSADHQRLEAETQDRTALEAAAAAMAEAQAAVAAAHDERDASEQARGETEQAANDAREKRHQAAEARNKVRAEIAALTDLLANATSGDWEPVIDSIRVDPGFEAALGAALGEDLDAATDSEAPRHWRILSPNAAGTHALPAVATPLADVVRGAPALQRRLAQVGVVEDAAAGEALANQLSTGQRLVSRAGDLWRWDGYTVKAGAPSTAAVRLQQRNRLAALSGELEAAERLFAAAEQALQQAQDVAQESAARERRAREAQSLADRAMQAASQQHDELTRKAAAAASRLEGLEETATRLEQDLSDIMARLATAFEEISSFDDLPAQREQAVIARDRLAEARAAQRAAQAAADQLERDMQERQRRQAAIAGEQASWTERQQNANNRIVALRQRRATVEAELAQLASRPAEIAEQRHALMDTLSQAEARRSAAADAVASGETAAADADKALKTEEAALAEAREQRVRVESLVAQAEQVRTTVRDRIAERLGCQPEGVLAAGGLEPDKPLLELEAAERKLERLLRERDNIGPVNLRAEQEADELDEQITTMQSERSDLLAAIARLRQGIANLNREARQRLTTSFAEVNQHFQELFTRLFGGGRAHLELIDSDDPLEAGLEIFASPPGKRLQALSLLSGGEQALTALALLFAVFQTNPAPICVLDEVDAPLDDANVDRFCALLDSMANSGQTRFLIITHHRMTMARMDRLYGVTMPERGVSQLVSVDLHSAEELRRTA